MQKKFCLFQAYSVKRLENGCGNSLSTFYFRVGEKASEREKTENNQATQSMMKQAITPPSRDLYHKRLWKLPHFHIILTLHFTNTLYE
jgi:hypothetical protein